MVVLLRTSAVHLTAGLATVFLAFVLSALLPAAEAQSSQVEAEWALFNEILIIGIIVGIVVFGLLFYAVIRYREKPGEK